MNINAQLQAASSLHAAGKLAEATKIYHQILSAQPDQVDALRLLGLVMAAQGNRERAGEYLQRAVALNPGFAAAHSSLGLFLAESGHVEQAIVSCRRALQLNPRLAGAHCGLALALNSQGDSDGAIASLRRAISVDPAAIMAWSNLAPLLGSKGDLSGSIYCYRRLCHLHPDRAQARIKLSTVLRGVGFAVFDRELKNDLVSCFHTEGVNCRDLAVAAATLLGLDPLLQPLIRDAGRYGQGRQPELLAGPIVSALNDELLLQILQKSIVPDRELECLLTLIRAHLLSLVAGDREGLAEKLAPLFVFTCSLAQQCFFNEYVFAQGDAENAAVEQLESAVESISLPPNAADRLLIAVYGCYRPLHKLAIASDLARLASGHAGPIFDEMISDQIRGPLAELAFRDQIPSLTNGQDRVSASVREQYEENPFPRWKDCTVRSPGQFEVEIGNILPGIEFPPGLDYASPQILIAGCGTGLQAVNCSHTYQNSQITAIDISRNSLAYAKRMTRELGIDNIEYLHADILELDKLGRSFDLIECGGVLHHLSNPFRGWEILSGLLKEGAFMMLALYSRIAREAVQSSREFAADKGYQATPEGIRACRQALFESQDPQIKETVTHNSAPFWTMSEVRDLIFHAMEHTYTIPELSRDISRLGLEFLGFQHPNPAEKANYIRCYPSDPDGLCLENWHEYEQQHPRTFTGMYHFWLRK